jgi:hypothetical protein
MPGQDKLLNKFSQDLVGGVAKIYMQNKKYWQALRSFL